MEWVSCLCGVLVHLFAILTFLSFFKIKKKKHSHFSQILGYLFVFKKKIDCGYMWPSHVFEFLFLLSWLVYFSSQNQSVYFVPSEDQFTVLAVLLKKLSAEISQNNCLPFFVCVWLYCVAFGGQFITLDLTQVYDLPSEVPPRF